MATAARAAPGSSSFALQSREPRASRTAAMVKLGANLSDKPEAKPTVEDGFDNIPLITPLEVNQLQKPFPDKVMVKTATQYQLRQKKKRNNLYVPSIGKFNINFYSDVSEKAKITGLILITLAFLTSVLLLLMYKAMWYDQLTCPEGFILKQKHCTPAALEMYYNEQLQPEQGPDAGRGRGPSTGAGGGTGLYASLSHLRQAKRAGAEAAKEEAAAAEEGEEREEGRE